MSQPLVTPAPGFDDPLGMLRACHERITRQCETLARIAELLPAGLTPELRTAAAAVHRYFSTAGQHHHDDEEQDLFPLLRGDHTLTALLGELEQDHVQMDRLWRELEPWLAAPETILNPVAFGAVVQQFNALYIQHIERENSELLPRASALLPAPILNVLGARMAARRGVTV